MMERDVSSLNGRTRAVEQALSFRCIRTTRQRRRRLLIEDIPSQDKCNTIKRMSAPQPSLVVVSSSSSSRQVIKSYLLAIGLASICAQFSSAAMNLPDGIENILGFVPKSTFQCERDGYFGDIDNDCKIFHLCQKQVHANGRTEWRHWTYACGNQTMFNQLTLTCAFVDEAIPCKHASQFQYLNEVIHKPREPFLTDADVTSGFSYYSNRIMSDGARARAFEDSRLMAQLGGQTQNSLQQSQQRQQQRQQLQAQNFFAEQPANNINAEEEVSNQALNSIEQANPVPATGSPVATGSFPQAPQINNVVTSHSQDLVIDHHQHIQHNSNQQQLQTGRLTHLQQHFAAAPVVPPATPSAPIVRPTSTSGAAEVRQQPATSPPASSFGFSISTNHQVGSQPLAPLAPPASPTIRHQPTPAATAPTTRPPATETPTTTAHQAEPVELVGSAGASGLANPPSTTTNSANNESLGTTQTAQTPTTTAAAPTSTLALVSSRAVGAGERVRGQRQSQRNKAGSHATRSVGLVVAPTGAANRNNQQQQQQQPARQPARDRRPSRFDHLNSAFQSTRLSASRQRQPDSALVMRRQLITTSTAANSQRQQPLAGIGPQAASSLLPAPGGGQLESVASRSDFWRPSFDSQFMGPRFESLLMRRRV